MFIQHTQSEMKSLGSVFLKVCEASVAFISSFEEKLGIFLHIFGIFNHV